MLLVLDEGRAYTKLYPLTYSRPVHDLRVGALSVVERFRLLFGAEIKTIVRNPILEVREESLDNDAVIVDSRVIANKNLIDRLNYLSGRKFIIKNKDKIIARSFELGRNYEVVELQVKFFERPYDLIRYNKEQLLEDLMLLSRFHEESKISMNKVGKYPIIVGDSFDFENPVFFDTREGPIFIGKDSYIQAFSRIEGPSYIGESSLIVTGSNIRRSYIGSHCTVGGEVTNSIIMDYTNSRHESYIGDSYIGEWVNVGAHTVISNMKNTYGEMSYEDLDGREKTGLRKLGVVMADHAKTSISCALFGGKSVGFSSQVISSLNKSIPSFTIWFGSKEEGYEFFLESAIESAKRFMESKKVSFTERHEKLFRKIFEATVIEREKIGIKRGSFKT